VGQHEGGDPNQENIQVGMALFLANIDFDLVYESFCDNTNLWAKFFSRNEPRKIPNPSVLAIFFSPSSF
jgi:hypothetical protein